MYAIRSYYALQHRSGRIGQAQGKLRRRRGFDAQGMQLVRRFPVQRKLEVVAAVAFGDTPGHGL